MGWSFLIKNSPYLAYPGASEYVGKGLTTSLFNDFIQNGKKQFVFIGTYSYPSHGSRPDFLFGILDRAATGWKILDYRTGHPDLLGAFLKKTANGVEIFLLVSRGNCDDEKVDHYSIRWDGKSGKFLTPFNSTELDPFSRTRGCFDE